MRTVVLPILGVALSAGSAFGAESFTGFNLVVRNNLTSSSEVEGRAAVGGNLGGPASNYGTMLTPALAFLGTDVLIVGGSINATNVGISAGNVRVAGGVSGNINHNGGGSTFADAGAGSIVSGLGAQMLSTSSFLAGLASDSSVSLPIGQPAPAVFNATPGPDGVAVFNVSAASVFQNNLVQSIDINLGSASSVIINVTGGSMNWSDGNFIGNFTSAFARANVLWNFHQATSIDLGGRAFNGAMLAPNAHVSFTGVIEGSAWVGSMNQMGEVHLPTYTGYVPAPGALALLGATGIMAARRRR